MRTSPQCPVPVSLVVEARFVGKRVVPRFEYKVLIDPQQDLEKQVDGMQCKNCFHSLPFFQEKCFDLLRLCLVVDLGMESWQRIPCCPVRATDAEVRFRKGQGESWSLEVVVWKDTGGKGPTNAEPWGRSCGSLHVVAR